MKFTTTIFKAFFLIGTFWLSSVPFQSTAQSPSDRFVAITFDDLPVVCRCDDDESRMEITNKLMAIFKKYNIPVLGVVNEQKLQSDNREVPSKVALLQKWLDNGHELGNHGYSHKDINELPFEEYKQEILKGERVTRPLAAKAGIPYRFYRHPYLSAGSELKIRQELDFFLEQNNYRIAPNTITYRDYTFSTAYDIALKDKNMELANRIRDAYLPYTLSQWETAEQQARDLFGRDIKQILMVHANTLNADVLGDIIEMMTKRGYTFITIDQALEDLVYSRPDTFDGNVGVTWLTRWAREKGVSQSYDRAAVPQFVLDAASKD